LLLPRTVGITMFRLIYPNRYNLSNTILTFCNKAGNNWVLISSNWKTHSDNLRVRSYNLRSNKIKSHNSNYLSTITNTIKPTSKNKVDNYNLIGPIWSIIWWIRILKSGTFRIDCNNIRINCKNIRINYNNMRINCKNMKIN
jgi:hypothetical protein